MTITDSFKLLNIQKGSILDVASFLDFRIFSNFKYQSKYK